MCAPEIRLPAPLGSETECHRGIFRIDDPLPAYAFQPTLSYDPVGGRLWTISDGTYRSVFCEGDNGLIAFDTFYSPGAAVSYRKALNRLFPTKPIHTVVYSHDHLDHTGFAADLAPSADVLAHADCAEIVSARASDGQLEPTEVLEEDRAEYRIDGVRFELHYPGPTHGNGNVAALFPEERAMFMVDTVIPGVGYTFLPDWHLSGYLATMRRLFEELEDWDTFIPGHYWSLDRAGAEANLRFFDALGAAAVEALIRGVDPDDLGDCNRAAGELLADHVALLRFHEYAGMNLMRMMLHIRQGGWGLEDARGVDRADGPAPPIGIADRLDAAGGAPTEVIEVADGLSAVGADDRWALAWAAPDGPACIGTLGSPRAATELGRAARSLAAGDLTLVLATDHLDQAGFADAVAPGEVIAHELAARALDGKLGGAGPTPTELIRAEGGRREVGGGAVDLLYPGPTFGTGTLAVHLSESSLLYVVGPRPDARYGLLGDLHLDGAVARWRRLLELEPEVVVFARGGVGTAADLERACAYLDGLSYAAQKGYAEGVAIWDVKAMEEYGRELLRGEFGGLDGFDRNVGIGTLRFAHHFLMGGWGIEDAVDAGRARGGGR